MGMLEEVLRHSGPDVGQGTRPPSLAQGSSPGVSGGVEGRTSPQPDGSRVIETVDESRADREVLGHDGQPTRVRGFDAAATERLVVSKGVSPALVEQFRILAAAVDHAQHEQQGLKSVIVTSASPKDGKSLVATNLALTLSESYRRQVLLIDADLRRPSLHHVFRLSATRGLSEAIRAKPGEKLPTMQVNETLTLLPAGRSDANPLGGLSSDRMRQIIEEAVARFDLVILDTPPVGLLADGLIVSEMVDAAILVVRAGVTPFPEVEAAVATVGRERILGVILNAVDPDEILGTDYYRHYYGPDTTDTRSLG